MRWPRFWTGLLSLLFSLPHVWDIFILLQWGFCRQTYSSTCLNSIKSVSSCQPRLEIHPSTGATVVGFSGSIPACDGEMLYQTVLRRSNVHTTLDNLDCWGLYGAFFSLSVLLDEALGPPSCPSVDKKQLSDWCSPNRATTHEPKSYYAIAKLVLH